MEWKRVNRQGWGVDVTGWIKNKSGREAGVGGNERRSIPVSRPNKDSTWIGKQAGIKDSRTVRVISGIRRNKI